MTPRGTIHLLVGPVGAGKSTYARARIARSPGVFFNLDTWMTRLFGADERPAEGVVGWYLARRERCRALVWDMSMEVLACGIDAYLETGLLAAAERQAFYEQVHAEGIALEVYCVDAPRDVRRRRVLARNESAGPEVQVVPLPFFEKASDAWEPPSEQERGRWRIVDV
ncbi:MAG: ATP-binding protein [Myxococcota bacterium]